MEQLLHCPDGRINDPSRFLNFVDRNCVPYTIPELILFAGGCLMWVVAYALIIRNARRTRTMDMAVVAVCSNFAWEFLWSFPFKTDMGAFLVWTYRAWFFLDIYIFWLTLQYGATQVATPILKERIKPITVGTLAAFVAIYYFFIAEGHDTLIGANSAYIAQLLVSGPGLILLLGNRSLTGLSWNVAWLRSFGTGANTVFMYMHYPANHFVQSMATVAFVLDMIYLGVFLNYRKSLRAASSTP